MFCTLRQSKNADEPYRAETSKPPFARPRSGSLVIACTNCRLSKIKCTGEPEGCRPCRSKHRSCHYQRSRSGTQKARPSQDLAAASKTPNDARGFVVDTSQQEEQDAINLMPMNFDYLSPPESTDALQSTGGYATFSDMADDSIMNFAMGPEMASWDDTTTARNPSPAASSAVHPSNDTTEPASLPEPAIERHDGARESS